MRHLKALIARKTMLSVLAVGYRPEPRSPGQPCRPRLRPRLAALEAGLALLEERGDALGEVLALGRHRLELGLELELLA